VDVAETSAFGTQAKTYVTGMQGSTISIEGEFDATVDAHLSALLGSEIAVAWQYGPESATSTRIRYSQDGTGTPIKGAIVTNYQVSSPVSDMVSFTLDLQVSGVVTRDTWP
jgi:predicted secreted protein